MALRKKTCRRGAQGAAIVLSPEARNAWEEAGSQQLCFGTRIIAKRLKVYDAFNDRLFCFS
jgi:hypothetical protein